MIDTAATTLNALIDRHEPPGFGAALVQGDRLALLIEHGAANIASGTPVTPDIVFDAGTLTQAVTLLVALRLTEAGLLDLDAPIEQFLHTYTLQAAGRVSARHLLSHTAGLGAARSLKALIRRDHLRPDLLREGQTPDLAGLYEGTLHAIRPPGEKWCYSADGLATLAQAMSDAAGQSFAALAQEQVFAPLGMESTSIGLRESFLPRLATTYTRRGSRYVAQPMQYSVQVGAWGLYSTLYDLTRLLAALLGHSDILRAETLAQAFTPAFQLDERLTAMGLGFTLTPTTATRLAWLSGRPSAGQAALWLDRDADSGLVAWANAPLPGLDATCRDALRPASTQDQVMPGRPEAPTIRLRGTYAPSPDLLTNLTLWRTFGGSVTVRQDRSGVRLAGQIDPFETTVMYPTADPLTYRLGDSTDAPLAVFLPGENDRAGRLLIGLYALDRSSYWRSLGGRLTLFAGAALLAFLLLLLLIALT